MTRRSRRSSARPKTSPAFATPTSWSSTRPAILELVPGGERCVYVAMELGTPLQTFLHEARLGAGSILALFCQVAEGLAAIHHEGLVHRDFKPGNVVLVKNVPKIVDFGLAVAVDADLGSTRSMRVVGTPAFMAPETLRGGQQDARSDQFSFAAALWQTLCGELPYNGADLDPDARRVHERPSASPARPLAKVLRRALSLALTDRFTDMRALVAALRAVAEPVLKRRLPRARRRRWISTPTRRPRSPSGVDGRDGRRFGCSFRSSALCRSPGPWGCSDFGTPTAPSLETPRARRRHTRRARSCSPRPHR
ncbi:MAG: serine/threonine protein kinase [Nannocystis sp.]|nr:serine/threonine protein kinase [Nannocystis sp.]